MDDVENNSKMQCYGGNTDESDNIIKCITSWFMTNSGNELMVGTWYGFKDVNDVTVLAIYFVY